MGEVFVTSGENSDNAVMPPPRLQGVFIPGIDDSLFTDGFGMITPLGGGSTLRKYGDYGISAEVSQQNTQLVDLAFTGSAIGGGEYGMAGLTGPQGPPGPPGPRGLPGLGAIGVRGSGITSLPSGYVFPINSNFLAELPHNIDEINDLGTAVDKLIYTDTYITHYQTEATWTERQPAGDNDIDWESVASDSDGSHLIVGLDKDEYGAAGGIYTSADYGVSWTERQPESEPDEWENTKWKSVASDDDGSHLIIAGGSLQTLYISSDYGATWTKIQPTGADYVDWISVASDDDGSHLIASIHNGRLYTSSTSGVTWDERRPAGDANFGWKPVASDSDGSNLIAGTNKRLYTSSTSGVTWDERRPAGDVDKVWTAVASDSDGSNLIAAVSYGRLYTSDDSGATWTERRPAGDADEYWGGVASNSDGSILAACSRTGLYTSVNSGVTWVSESAIDFDEVALDSDGSNIIVADWEGRLYTGVRATAYSEATWGETSLTSAGRALLDDANAAAQATTIGVGTGDSPEFTGLTLSGLTSTRLVSSGSALGSVADLTAWVGGTANQITSSDDEDGTLTLSITNPFAVPGKVTAGSFASPTDVTNTRQYGLELHYSGNNYNVTGIRSRARLKTTDTTATAQGALLQAANENGINAGVLNGALIEAIGKSDANAATIAVMRGCLVNTEWGDYDTVTNLKTLHVRTHSRNAAGAGSFGTGYGIYIENEAVGGNGQAYDAGIYFKGTNLSAGNKAFTYGIDFRGATYGTSEIIFADGSTIGSGNIAGGRYGINVETLTGDKTLTPKTDKMYQYLDEGGSNRIITLATVGVIAGDRFVIRHNGLYNDAKYLEVKQGAVGLDLIFSGAIKEFIFDGTDWISGETGAGENNTKARNVAIGDSARGQSYGTAVGALARGYSTGVAVGYAAFGYALGAALGANARGYGSGVAVGEDSKGYTDGVAIGRNAIGARKGVAVGYYAGSSINTAADRFNILVGYRAGDTITTGTYNLLFGYDVDVPANDTSNFMSLGNIIFATGVDGTGTTISSGKVGIAEPAPETLLEMTGTAPYLTLHNSTHEDSDGGRESRINFKGEQGVDPFEETTLARIEVSHDGSGADDKGKIVISVNDGDDGDTPTQALEIGSDLLATFGGAVNITTIAAEDSDVDKFLVDSSGVIKYRTGAQILSDIGGAGAGAHTIASHSDTTATGTELETLTDGSETALHSHAAAGGGNCSMKTGTYTGNGVDDREIDIGVNLAAKTYAYLIIKMLYQLKAVHRIEHEQGNLTMFYDATDDSADFVKSFTANGFIVSDEASVNFDGKTYRYIAFWVD